MNMFAGTKVSVSLDECIDVVYTSVFTWICEHSSIKRIAKQVKKFARY